MTKAISDLTNMDGNATIDRSADFIEVSDSTGPTSYKATPNFILGISGDPVGTTDSQTLTNKTLTQPVITADDDEFTLQDNADTTKKLNFQLSGITTSTTRTLTVPDVSDTIVTLGATQTLTNKTLTSPTINTATISNPTLTVDTVSEHTSANGVTVDGLNIKDGVLNTDDSVKTSNYQDDSVTDDKLDYPRWWQEIGRTTLGSAGDTITVSSLPARKYLRILVSALNSGSILPTLRFNNDTGSNYANRRSDLGAVDATSTSLTAIVLAGGAGSFPFYLEIFVTNIAAQEKLPQYLNRRPNTAGAGNAPFRDEGVGKWANTADQISRVDIVNTSTGDFAIGSEVVVLGHD